jgi:crotonobetaine/carnitine-CoA ligase
MNAEAAATALALHERTLPGLLRRQAGRFAGRPLMRISGGAWSFGEAVAAAAGRAATLRAAGFAAGDRVALMCSNRIEFLELFLGCGWMGCVSVPINTAAMGPQLAYYLANSGAKLLVIEDQFMPRLELVDLSATALEAIWVVGSVPPADRGSTHPEVRSWPAAGAADTPPAPLRPGDPLAILYTSGTTGPAKGVICPHAQYVAWGTDTACVLGLRDDDVLCTTLPLFHINALNTLAQALVCGCRAVFEPRFSASGFWAAMQAAEASVIYLLGAMVPILLTRPETGDERQHRIRVGLGPGVPDAARTAFERRTGIVLLDGYGSTETNFVIATAPDSPRPGVMGWLRPGFEARVVDEDDGEVPAGQPGELILRAAEPFAFASGYFGMADKTVEAWRNLWFHTGDRVVRDADGAFRFIDRIKDAIRRRGENISSWEVEQVLLLHPAIAEAAVYPVRSELAEDEVMAAIVLRPGASLDPEAVVEFCATRLPKFAMPRYIDIRSDLPRTENGKLQKFRLREQGVTPTTWERPKPG